MSAPKKTASDKKKSQAQLLLELTTDLVLFHDAEGNGLFTASFKDEFGERFENHRLKSRSCHQLLRSRYYAKYKSGCSEQSLKDAINTLEAQALAEKNLIVPALRVAADDNSMFVDLGGPRWQSVEINARGWVVTNRVPVRFIRNRGMLPLPEPHPDGNASDLLSLRRLFRITDDGSWTLLLAWLIGSLMPTGPFAILVLVGEPGSGKSWLARALQKIIDPSAADLRALPSDARDAFVAAHNTRLLCFDNLSGISREMADVLCRISTGGGYCKRENYSDADEVILNVIRPLLINGIDDLTGASDLADRSILLNLPAIPEDNRMPEAELWQEFERIRPRVLGALFTAASAAMRNLATARESLKKLPRLADFAVWVSAAEPELGIADGDFMRAYQYNRRELTDLGIESPLVEALRGLLLIGNGMITDVTAAELLKRLQRQAEDVSSLPKVANRLTNELRRLGPDLRRVGITYEFYKSHGQRKIKIQQQEISA